MSKNEKEEVEEVQECPACGGAHPTNEWPLMCRNVLMLAQGIYDYVTNDDDASADGLAKAAEVVLGISEEEGDEGEDEEEFFN